MKPSTLSLLSALALLAPTPGFAASAQTVPIDLIYAFSGTDGANPQAAPIVGNDGNLYGTTNNTGPNGHGTVYMVSPDGKTFATLHTFNGSDGSPPNAGLLQASDGFLYGTTVEGGPNGGGTVFKVSTDGKTFATVYAFSGVADLYAGLIQADDGFLYGVTAFGDTNSHGTVFAVSTDGTTFRTVHTFSGGDGTGPQGTLVEGLDGNLYGTTLEGGTNDDGVVFMVSRDGQTFQDLHTFEDSDGFFLASGLLLASDGNLYGTASEGGAGDDGTVFMVSTDGTTFNVLHAFDSTDGALPESGLLQASDGNLYGTTFNGGASSGGTAFMVSPDGKTFNSLYSFGGNGDGDNPVAGLVQAGDGNFYGAAQAGGNSSGDGTVYRLDVTLPDVVQFHASINSVNETAGTASVRVDRIGYDGAFVLVVAYTLTDGTAQAGTDYSDGGNGFLEWVEDDTTPKFITVNITNRGFTDGSLRTLSLMLSNVTDGGGSGTTLDYPTTATLTINGSIPGAPVITSAPMAAGTVGQPFSYQITASAGATRFGALGLPKGLTVDARTGLISGTFIAAGQHTLTLAAVNGAGKGTATLTLPVTLAKPIITSPTTASGHLGGPFSYQITATGEPRTYGVTGLGSESMVVSSTGLITGRPIGVGTHTLTLYVGNAAGTAMQTLLLTVDKIAPVITSATTASATVGSTFDYQITADNAPGAFGVAGLPPGLTVDAKTGQITGAPTKAGTFTPTLEASNSKGKDSQTLTLTVTQ